MIARILLPLIIVSLLVPVLLLGCSETKIPKQEINMVPNVTIPVIDASMPTGIETATFALG
ncbi:hypothetical protein ACFLUO_01395 [Chloroflexota bacterium]